MTDTLRYVPNASLENPSLENASLDSTHVSPASRVNSLVAPSPAVAQSGVAQRTTVLPRVEWSGAQPNVIPFERERFEEVRTLGQGGMGEVVLLKDHDIERMVALKRLPAAPDMDRVLRFVEEIRTVGQLDHPNIVPVHDVGVDQLGRYYFMMKHLQGETLESIIERLRKGEAAAHARFPFPQRIQIFIGVLNALTYAHGKGYIHRDLKPANIMVGPYGEVTVLDWGLARRLQGPDSAAPRGIGPEEPNPAVSRRTQVGAVVGTPLYMSPEQARGAQDAVDARSDIYSLSVLLHELLYLNHYLDGRDTLAEVLEGVQNVTPVLHHLKSNDQQAAVPAEYAWFLKRGFAKDVALRYQSLEEMAAELRNAMEGRIQMHCQRTLLKRGLHEALRRVDEHPSIMLLGSVGVLGVVIAALVQLLLSFHAG